MTVGSVIWPLIWWNWRIKLDTLPYAYFGYLLLCWKHLSFLPDRKHNLHWLGNPLHDIHHVAVELGQILILPSLVLNMQILGLHEGQ